MKWIKLNEMDQNELNRVEGCFFTLLLAFNYIVRLKGL